MGSTSLVEIRTKPVGPWPMNPYVLVCPLTRDSLLIDPGAEPETLLTLLDGTLPRAILLTHTHADHIQALDEMRARLRVPVMAHPGPHVVGVTLHADRWLSDGEMLEVGQQRVRVSHTPGHTSDMLSFMIENEARCIVGDTIFEGGPGRTWSPEGFRTTLYTIRSIVLSWPNETICYPGHGPSFRLGEKRAAIEAFVEREHGDFFGDATW